MKMKTIVKTAKELAEILGVTERTITNRGKKLSALESEYKIEVMNGEMTLTAVNIKIGEYEKSHLAGYSCNRSGNPQRPRYTFFSND